MRVKRRALAALLVAAPLCVALSAAAPQSPSQSATPTRSATPPPSPIQSPSPAPTPAPAPQSVADDDVLSVNTDLVNVLFNAEDKNRRFVTTLAREDVRVFEDDAPQSVSVFERETALPLSLAILVDVSDSQKVTLGDEKEAASEFVDSVVRPGKDSAAVVSFTGTATVEQDLTEDRAALHAAVERLKAVPPAPKEEQYAYDESERGEVIDEKYDEYGLPGSTALWDAVWATAHEMMSESPRHARRAIIILSDGDDSSSRVKREEAAAEAVKADTTIYAIGVPPDCPGHQSDCRLDKKALRRVAEDTGGRAFFPEDDVALRAAFAEINQELRTQYLVAYSPTNKVRDGGWRRIRIEIANPKLKDQKIKLSYREGYFATARAAQPPARERAPEERLKRPPRKSRKR